MSEMWSTGCECDVRCPKTYQEYKMFNWMMQMNFAEMEIMAMVDYLRRQKMIKLSNGVEVSEDTIVSALKKAGISVEPKPKHFFKAGDVVESGAYDNAIRIIVNVGGKLESYDTDGYSQSTGQEQFEKYNYKFIGRLTDILS